MKPCFLNVPVDVQIQWPCAQATIAFGAWEIIAFPASQNHDPSLHIETDAQPVEDEKARRALAIYREAVNMQHFHSQPYAVLGFYKIVESAFPNGTARGEKLEQEVADLLNRQQEQHTGIAGYLVRTEYPTRTASFVPPEGR